MNYLLFITIGIIALGITGIWFSYKFLKRKKEKSEIERNVPTEILEIFNKAEQEMKGGIKEDGTTENQYKILWKIAREKSGRRVNSEERKTNTTDTRTSSRELQEQPGRQQDIQDRTITESDEDKYVDRESKQYDIRGTIASIRRRISRRKN